MNPLLSRRPWLELSKAEQKILLDMVHAIISGIQSGRADEVTQLLDELTGIRESHLFQELGRLTRQLHEALTSFERDAAITRLADTQIPAAKERLRYVMAKSEEATHQTLAAIEDTVPIVNGLGTRAKELGQLCLHLSRSDMRVAELPTRLGELLDYFDSVRGETAKISSNLTKVLMAQEAQDLTGQVIRRVIELVQDLEAQLVGFMASCGDFAPKTHSPARIDTTKLEGPQLKAAHNPDVISSQDEVDDLLSSLGF
ncbi:MAG: protein phosphatase CheZ [Gammaproteobacteria bacterium]